MELLERSFSIYRRNSTRRVVVDNAFQGNSLLKQCVHLIGKLIESGLFFGNDTGGRFFDKIWVSQFCGNFLERRLQFTDFYRKSLKFGFRFV